MRAPYIESGDASLCTGCSACSFACPTGAISMGEDALGFAYPIVDEAMCVRCGRCLSACHMADPDGLRSGSAPRAYGACATDRGQVRRSASGGVATAIALDCVERGGVVYGCVADREDVRHERLASPEGVERSRGSKYVQSDVSGALPRVAADLRTGAPVTFVGTPCQCAALRRLFGERDNLLLVDLVCEGVPSRRMYADFLDHLEEELGSCVTDFRFRDKRGGWSTRNPVVVGSGGTPLGRQLHSHRYWYCWLFTHALTLRDSCYACPYACPSRVGDVTVGDFWGVETVGLGYGLRELRAGVSCVLVGTERGNVALRALGARLDLRPCDLSDVAKANGCLTRPSPCDKRVRDYVLGEYRARGAAGEEDACQALRGPAVRFREAVASLLPLWARALGKQALSVLGSLGGP